MPVVFLAYLLLCQPVVLRLDACLSAQGTSAHIFVGMLGAGVRADFSLRAGKDGLQAVHLFAGSGRERRDAGDGAIRRILSCFLRASKEKRIDVYAMIGMEDAAQTALMTGALRAVVSSSAAAWIGAKHARIEIVPSFGRPELTAVCSGIFAASPGDIMAALIGSLCRRSAGKKRERNHDGSAPH